MACYSPNRRNTAIKLADALRVISASPKAETPEARLVPLAQRAEHFASVWLRCTTEHGRADMRAHSAALVERATAIHKESSVTSNTAHYATAFAVLGAAYQAYGDCEYRNAEKLAAHALKWLAHVQH